MRGPLPDPNAQRRNAPTIPTTNLPQAGRSDPPPVCPLDLGRDGLAWWEWAWSTPQAAGWSDGDAYFVAHRAALEDDVRAMRSEDFDVAELLEIEKDTAMVRRLNELFRRMKALAAGKVSITKTMTDMDDRLGLTPKGMAALRWKIVADEEPAKVRALRSTSGKAEDPRRLLA